MESGLTLRNGDRVRFRRTAGQHWTDAVVEGFERDGSVALRDANGASRAIRAELIEVWMSTKRSGRWVPATSRRWEQLALFAPDIGTPRRPRRR
jgi:hypothetical protein